MVCNAGVARDNAFPAMSGEDWDIVLNTNLDGFYNVLNPLVMPMVQRRKPGRIVTLASVSGLIGNRGQVNYSAAKAGIIGATKALALELAKRAITVNCVAPGLIETDMISDVPLDEALKMIPARRVGTAGGGGGRGQLPDRRGRRLHHAPGHLGQRRHGMSRRVVVTGMAGISPLGNDWASHPRAPGRVPQRHRPHGRVGRLRRPEHAAGRAGRAVRADRTLPPQGDAQHGPGGADGHARQRTGAGRRRPARRIRCSPAASMGVAFGSSAGTPSAIGDFGRMMEERTTKGINATTYIKMMAHTAPVNIGVFFGLTGRVITTSSACTSGSQGIGYAYEAIQRRQADAMIAGGAEELCATEAAVFDTLFATSMRNDAPDTTPRPFDARPRRPGGRRGRRLPGPRGARARASRAAPPSTPSWSASAPTATAATSRSRMPDTMKIAMQLALADAGLQPADIGYINAHGTATEQGDIAETQATAQVFGSGVPISSLKSYMGHTLGACGALEAWISIEMMREGWFAPTINLDQVDPQCADLDYITGDGRRIDCEYVMSNNFAFGGINTSLIFKRQSS